MLNDEELHDLLETAHGVEKLLSVIAKQMLRQVMTEELADEKAVTVYSATGEKTITEIAALTGWSPATISRTWSRWERVGLLEKNGRSYRKTVESRAERETRETKKAKRKDSNVSGEADAISLFADKSPGPELTPKVD